MSSVAFRSSILAIYTGGTIGMQKNKRGVFEPKPGVFLKEIKRNPLLHDVDVAATYFNGNNEDSCILRYEGGYIRYTLKEYETLMDSSNMGPKEWIKIAIDVKDNYHNFDGFVIIQGTDTLAYTASILSFMFEALGKPVIVTGAQVSIFEPDSDGIENLAKAVILAACYRIPEVAVFFHNKLMRGNRVVKSSSVCMDAFSSPNYPPLATTESKITINEGSMMKNDKEIPFRVHTSLNNNVSIINYFPTMTVETLRSLTSQPLHGAVLRCFGSGNFPTGRRDLLDLLEQRIQEGLFVIVVTQCWEGHVTTLYEAGKILEDAGVIPGFDMTTEAAYAKLCYVLAMPSKSLVEKRSLLTRNLRGEMTKK